MAAVAPPVNVAAASARIADGRSPVRRSATVRPSEIAVVFMRSPPVHGLPSRPAAYSATGPQAAFTPDSRGLHAWIGCFWRLRRSVGLDAPAIRARASKVG